MRHSKLAGLMTPMERVARVAAQASSTAASARTRQSGSISVTNSDGSRTVLGAVNGTDASGMGVSVATHVGDTTAPGRPVGVTAASSAGVIVAFWSGSLEGGIPDDFDHVTMTATSSDGLQKVVLGKLSREGSVTSAALASGTTWAITATAEDDAHAEDGTLSPNVSAQSDSITVTVTNTVADVDKEISEQNETISGIQGDITDLTTDVDTVKTTVKEAKDTADEVSETLSADYSKTGTDTSYVTASTNLQTADEIMQSVSGTYATQTALATTDAKADAAQSTADDAATMAITMAITTDNGSVFKNSADTTTLTAHVYRAGAELSSQDVAKLCTVKWYRDGGTTAVGTGATLSVSASSVSSKAVYTAQLEG
jgi:hypothetical protein